MAQCLFYRLHQFVFILFFASVARVRRQRRTEARSSTDVPVCQRDEVEAVMVLRDLLRKVAISLRQRNGEVRHRLALPLV